MDLTGAYEDAVAILAFKVAFSLNRAIVLANGVVERDTDPDTCRKRGLTNEEHLAMAKIGNVDTGMQMQRLGRCHCS